MRISFWLLIVLLIVGAVLGAGGIIASIAFNRYTSTDAFCTSCHTMAFQADDPYFQHSAHRSANKGVRPSCGDCHIPKTNWFVETYTHVSSGLRDAYAEVHQKFQQSHALGGAPDRTRGRKFRPICIPRTASPAAVVMTRTQFTRRAKMAGKLTPCCAKAV